MTIQIFLFYVFFKLSITQNIYKRVFLLFFILWGFGSVLFYYQVEVFACFLLVNEMMVCLFIFILMIYCGFETSTPRLTPNNLPGLGLVCLLFLAICTQLPTGHYLEDSDEWEWFDYYLVLISPTFNDLMAPYYFFYHSAPDVLIFLGLFLFILSIVYLYLFFIILAEEGGTYMKQNNNTESHTFRKPSVGVFKTTFNDL